MLSVDEYLPRGATFIKKTNKTTTVFSEEESCTLMSPLHVPGYQEKNVPFDFSSIFLLLLNRRDGGESGSDSQTRDSQPIYQDSHGLETCILSNFINKIY